jgi:hypothetical protein
VRIYNLVAAKYLFNMVLLFESEILMKGGPSPPNPYNPNCFHFDKTHSVTDTVLCTQIQCRYSVSVTDTLYLCICNYSISVSVITGMEDNL